MRLLALALLWTAWCALHSAMISLSVTERLRAGLGDLFRWYRLFYVVVAAGTLAPLYLYSRSLHGAAVLSWGGPWRILQALLALAAVLLFAAGARHYDFLQLVGLRQVREGEARRGATESGGLDTGGVLGAIRHPWYAGGIALLWARDLDAPQFTVSAVLTAYLVVGAFLEERKLEREFGVSYLRYRDEVSMLFPFKWLRARLAAWRRG